LRAEKKPEKKKRISRWCRHCERKRSNPVDPEGSLDRVVARAPLRKRFAFVAGDDEEVKARGMT
jgi:hypothetical protein